MEMIEFRQNLYQLSYAAKLQKMQYFITVINVNCKLNRQKVNEYIIHIEIMKFAIMQNPLTQIQFFA